MRGGISAAGGLGVSAHNGSTQTCTSNSWCKSALNHVGKERYGALLIPLHPRPNLPTLCPLSPTLPHPCTGLTCSGRHCSDRSCTQKGSGIPACAHSLYTIEKRFLVRLHQFKSLAHRQRMQSAGHPHGYDWSLNVIRCGTGEASCDLV